MPSSISADAVRAAVAVAAGFGVVSTDPVVLADGANIIVHLRPAAVVAKVAASTPAVRPDAAAWLRRELDLTVFLERSGVPVMAPAREVPAEVQRLDGHVMSFWEYLDEPSAAGRPDEDRIGSMLRDLHAVLRGYPGPLPAMTSLGDIPAFLNRPETRLDPGDAAVLNEACQRLTGELARATRGAGTGSGAGPAAGQVLHGDAGAGNLMAVSAGGGLRWLWHDFEDTCTGPVEWDLAATTASPRLSRSRILAAYGTGIDDALLRTCEQLRRLHLTIWYALYAERLPECRPRAAELIAGWRGP